MGGKVKDLAGQKFGDLTVIQFIGIRAAASGHTHAEWLCFCDCGNTRTALAYALKNGMAKRCVSCKVKTRKVRPALAGDEAAFRVILSKYKNAAKSRGLDFSLSVLEFRTLITQNCWYCGVAPRQVAKTKFRMGAQAKGTFTYNGIDRVDSNLGYLTGNVVPSCIECNRAKMDLPAKAFTAWARRLGAYQIQVQNSIQTADNSISALI